MTTMFDLAARTDTNCGKRAESIFAYLNRSAKSGSEVSRRLIEEMFSRVPADRRHELRSRFRSGSDNDLASVFQELCLHDLLLKQTCELILHPGIVGTTKRPDFLVLEPEGSQFILEAKNSTEVSSGPRSAPRRNRVLDFLQGFKPAGFLIGVDELTAGSKDLSRRLLVRHITESLQRASSDGTASFRIPILETDDGWKIRLRAIPDRSYGKMNGSILYEGWSRTWSDQSNALSEALIEKAGRYGKHLGVPFVIAINSFDAMLADRDFSEALVGEGGLWGTSNTPRYRRVSAVLFTSNLWPATLLMGHVKPSLYLNPCAEWPYSGVLTQFDTFRFDGGSWQCYPGTPIHQLLQLDIHSSSLWD